MLHSKMGSACLENREDYLVYSNHLKLMNYGETSREKVSKGRKFMCFMLKF